MHLAIIKQRQNFVYVYPIYPLVHTLQLTLYAPLLKLRLRLSSTLYIKSERKGLALFVVTICGHTLRCDLPHGLHPLRCFDLCIFV